MKQTASTKQEQPMALLVVSREDLKKSLCECFSKLGATFEGTLLEDFCTALVNSKWAKDTKNGALKVTTSSPKCKENIKATTKVADTTFYFKPMSKSNTIALQSLRSYSLIEFAKDKIRKAIENMKTLDDWKTAEGKTYFAKLGESGELATLFASGKSYDDIMTEGYNTYKLNIESAAANIEEESEE